MSLYCKSLWIRVFAKWLNVNVKCWCNELGDTWWAGWHRGVPIPSWRSRAAGRGSGACAVHRGLQTQGSWAGHGYRGHDGGEARTSQGRWGLQYHLSHALYLEWNKGRIYNRVPNNGGNTQAMTLGIRWQQRTIHESAQFKTSSLKPCPEYYVSDSLQFLGIWTRHRPEHYLSINKSVKFRTTFWIPF